MAWGPERSAREIKKESVVRQEGLCGRRGKEFAPVVMGDLEKVAQCVWYITMCL